jgi:hypothetical protein
MQKLSETGCRMRKYAFAVLTVAPVLSFSVSLFAEDDFSAIENFNIVLPNGNQISLSQPIDGNGPHAGTWSDTYGCLHFGSQGDANEFVKLSDRALASSNGSSTLTVSDGQGL